MGWGIIAKFGKIKNRTRIFP